MLLNSETNSAEDQKTQQGQQESSTFMEILQNKLKDVKNFSNWSAKEQMLAISAVGAIFGAALPILAIALPVAATGAIVALTLFFAVKAVEYTFKGLKWSAEKTVEGAKYIGGKIKDGAVHVKNKVEEGYEHSVDSLKKSASFVGEGVANKFHKASGETDYLDKIKRFAPEEIEKSDEIRKDMKEIFADKGNNSGLVKDILSRISSEIDSKIKESKSCDERDRLQTQKEFINNLNEGSLQSLLTERSLPKRSYFIDSVFSDHYDEIKEVIKECKADHILKRSLKMRNNVLEEGSARPNRSFSLPSFSLLGRNNSEQSNSLSRSSSLNSIGTESTEPLVKVGKSTFYVDTPTPTESTAKTAIIGGRPGVSGRNSISNLTRVETLEVPTLACSSSSDSGFNSPTSSPIHKMFTNEDGKAKTQADLKKTVHLDKVVLPSVKVDLETDVQQHAATQKATVACSYAKSYS